MSDYVPETQYPLYTTSGQAIQYEWDPYPQYDRASEVLQRLSTANLSASSVYVVGTRAAPITNPATIRPNAAGVVYWMCANGVTPSNALPGDLIWNASS